MDGKHAASTLQELQERFGFSQAEIQVRSRALGVDFVLGRNWLSNIRNRNAVPDLRKIFALGEIFQLALLDLFHLFGYDLNVLGAASAALHVSRTRLLEHRILGRSQSTVPSSLAAPLQSTGTAFLSQLVEEWRTVPTNQIRGEGWQDPHVLYAKLGVNDSNAAPTIPPGSYLQVLRMPAKTTSPLSPKAIYLIQHPWGLTASRCALHNGVLYVHSENPSYTGPFRLQYGSQGRILGLVTAYAAELPTAPYRRSDSPPSRQGAPSAQAPWEYRHPNGLLFEQYRRCGMTRKEFKELSFELATQFGFDASARYIEELRATEHFPRTSTLLALSALTATRLSDIFASCGVHNVNHERFHLDELLSLDCKTLPTLPPRAILPKPPAQWLRIQTEWREWPLLLQPLFDHPGVSLSVLRFSRDGSQSHPPPFFPETSFLLLQRHRGGYSALNSDASLSDWARRLYVIEHGRDVPRLECGYLSADGGNVLLTPHRASPTRSPAVFRKDNVAILGTVVGIAARTPA